MSQRDIERLRFVVSQIREIEEARLFQKQSALALWYRTRTADSRLGTRKMIIVALARKLLIALWCFVTIGEPLEGVILRPAR